MRWKYLLAAGLILCAGAAKAQQQPDMANVVSACGTPNSTYTTNATKPQTVDSTGSQCVSSSSASPIFVVPGHVTPLGYQQLTSLASATALTVPATATIAVAVCTGQTIYWRDDGVSPTATVGMPLTQYTPYVFTTTLSTIKFIQESATATCNVSYYK